MNRHSIRLIPLLTLLALLAPLSARSARAATLRVPQDYSNIQGALNVAKDGDEVVVSPGVYNGNFEINSLVVLRSTFDGHDWSIVENTVLKGVGTSYPVVSGYIKNSQVPTIRGFRITRDSIAYPYETWADGLHGSMNVEYNIVENQVNLDNPMEHGHAGGAIVNNYGGVIQNNVIRNNNADFGAAFYSCGSGVIRNNVIYGNTSDGIVDSCSSDLINNTFYGNNSSVAIGDCRGKIANNIVWETLANTPNGQGIPIAASTTPHHCILQGYSGPGVGNIDADPRFVNPAQGDFHLRPDSPAMDSGVSTQGLTLDLEGNPRGALWRTQPGLGDGSHTDIGAYEFQPQPLTLWTPAASEPAMSGRPLTLRWALGASVTPVAFDLTLTRPGQSPLGLGRFATSAGHSSYETAGQWQVTLPAKLPPASDYQAQARNASSPLIQTRTAPFAIQFLNAIPSTLWLQYP